LAIKSSSLNANLAWDFTPFSNMKTIRFLRSTVWLLLSVFFTIAGSEAVNAQSGELALKSGDKFSLKVGGIPDNEVAQIAGTYTVSDDGTIPLLHLGNVRVSGVKPSDLQRRISQAYIEAQIYTHPSVVVNIDGDPTTMRQVTVISGVATPGAVPYTQGLTLLAAIGARGGPTAFADMRKVKLLRTDGSGQTSSTVHNLKNYDKDPSVDAELRPGDKIIVPD
jgi:polysaccharide export outer membrane protein